MRHFFTQERDTEVTIGDWKNENGPKKDDWIFDFLDSEFRPEPQFTR